MASKGIRSFGKGAAVGVASLVIAGLVGSSAYAQIGAQGQVLGSGSSSNVVGASASGSLYFQAEESARDGMRDIGVIVCYPGKIPTGMAGEGEGVGSRYAKGPGAKQAGGMLGGIATGGDEGGMSAFGGQISSFALQAEGQELHREFRSLFPVQAQGMAGAQGEKGEELFRASIKPTNEIKPTLPTEPPASGGHGTVAWLVPAQSAGWTVDGSSALDLVVQAPAGSLFALFEAETGTIVTRGRVHQPKSPLDPPTVVEVKLPNAAKDLDLSTLGLVVWKD